MLEKIYYTHVTHHYTDCSYNIVYDTYVSNVWRKKVLPTLLDLSYGGGSVQIMFVVFRN